MVNKIAEVRRKYILSLTVIYVLSLPLAAYQLYVSLTYYSDKIFSILALILSCLILLAIFVIILAHNKMNKVFESLQDENSAISDMYAELLALNKDVEDIVAERTLNLAGLRIADRIRNPITIIAGNCRNVLKTAPDAFVRERLQNILVECKKIEEAVYDFDRLVKSKSFQFKLEDLNEIVLSTIKVIKGNLQHKNIDFSLKLSEDKLFFNANRQLIRICIHHVLNNAIDAVSENSIVTIQTGRTADGVFVKVIDFGKGIAEEDLEHITQPFYSTKGKPGMGLSLVSQIVKEHMGSMHIESKLAVGTSVELRFPFRWQEGEIFLVDAKQKANEKN